MDVRRVRSIAWSVALGTVLVLTTSLAVSRHDSLTTELREEIARHGDVAQQKVILHLSDRFDPSPLRSPGGRVARGSLIQALHEHSRSSQVKVRRRLRGEGAANIQELWMINAMAVRLRGGSLRRLSADPDIARISLDRTVRLAGATSERKSVSGPPAHTSLPVERNISAVQAPALWDSGIDGAGVVIGVVDSGVDAAHADLSARWRGGDNSWYDPRGVHSAPHDGFGHGTQVAGILVGGAAGGTSIGMAPGAVWIAAKSFDDTGDGTYSDIHQGLQWMLDPDGDAGTDDAAHVVNNSWGLTDDVGELNAEFQADVQMLQAAGIAVVFSAGNSGPAAATSLSPGNYPESVAVGATSASQLVAGFSSRGPSAGDGEVYPELAAPGVDIWTSDRTFGGVFPYSYVSMDGTSFAAPHVAGALALLMHAYPSVSVELLTSALINTARDLDPEGPDQDSGQGLLDLAAADAWLFFATQCTDVDADGRSPDGGACGVSDCDDADATLWSAPSEVRDLASLADTTTWTWLLPGEPGGLPSTVMYDVLRSASPTGFMVSLDCIESGDGSDTVAVDSEIPDPGTVFNYLIRPRGGCGGVDGSLGRDSQGQERSGSPCP